MSRFVVVMGVLAVALMSVDGWPEWGNSNGAPGAEIALKRGGDDDGVIALKRGGDDDGVIALKRGGDDDFVA